MTIRQPDLSTVFQDLFTAPVQATLDAEARYRAIWYQWLSSLLELLNARAKVKPDFDQAAFIQSQLAIAPVMRFEARIDVGVSLRITGVRQSQFGGTFGIQLSVLQASGSYSFASQDTQESVMHARATYALANTSQTSLKDYLDAAALPLTKADEFTKALEFLAIKPATKLPDAP